MGILDGIKGIFSGGGRDVVVDQDQTPEEQDLVRFVYRLFDDARKARVDVEKTMKDNWKAYRGRDKQKLPKYKKKARLNICFSIVEAILPWLTENKPEIIFIPGEKDDISHAEIMQKIVDNLWVRLAIQYILTRLAKAGLVFNKGFLKVLWNVDAAGGIGEVDVRYVSPFKIYPDPDCQSPDIQDCMYVIESYPLDLGTIRRMFPKRGWKVKPDAQLSQMYPGEYCEPLTARHNIDDVVTAGGNWRAKGRLRARIIECWFKDDTVEVLREQDSDGSEVTRHALKYPNGRVITVANGVLLDDRPNPYLSSNGKVFPYVSFDNYDNLDEDGIEEDTGGGFWPISEVEQLTPIQNALDDLIRRVLDNAALTGNMQWILDQESGVDPETLTNQPGLIVRKNKGTEVRREKPPEMAAYIMQLLTLLPTWGETVSGVHDVTQGRRPQGITAAAAIAELQEAGQARIRLKNRSMEKTVKDLGELIKSRVMQFYPPGRIIRVVGKDKQVQFIPFDPRNIKGDFDVLVEAGSSLPVSKAGKYNQATFLFEKGAIDAQALLEAVEWPNREEVLQRMGRLQQSGGPAGAPVPGATPPITPPAVIPPEAVPQDIGDLPPGPGAGIPQVPPDVAIALLGLLQQLQQGGSVGM
ncbi:MAG: hypothetical protein AB1510_02180 [Bacillota bacterium]